MDDDPRPVWAFVGEGGRWPSAIFSSRDRAEEWIGARRLTGMLTKYPLDVPVYEWAVETDTSARADRSTRPLTSSAGSPPHTKSTSTTRTALPTEGLIDQQPVVLAKELLDEVSVT
ncbi:DUF7710 domain-containing protein [Sphaerisporangium corydalis]|uniref:DUF7710 domain-containing protein n=1 Tax=Sphaerisporangium corydalis TaxID=1441875 RepID=A0ABV9E855_9ACTN|nr:hypothetical protein [Sphaerisporangium corydalis]